MAKSIKVILKLQLSAGKATPAPPVGTALGPHGINIGQFVKQFNDATADKGDSIIPAEITIFEDRTFTFVLKTPPASDLLRKAAGVEKGSGKPNTAKAGQVTKDQIGNNIALIFNKPSVGINNKLKFNLSFTTKDVAKRLGKIIKQPTNVLIYRDPKTLQVRFLELSDGALTYLQLLEIGFHPDFVPSFLAEHYQIEGSSLKGFHSELNKLVKTLRDKRILL